MSMYTKRKNICNDCPSRKKLICGECGCILEAKLLVSFSKCPLGKWDSVNGE